MRKLLGLAVLFVVLCMCVPSYGYYLIYNVSGTVKGVNNTTPTSIPWKAYLVLDFNDSDDLVDANLIMYGTDSNTPKKQKVYIQLNYSDSAHLLDTDGFWQKGAYTAFDFWSESDNPFDFVGFVIGKSKATDIGLGLANKKNIPSSLTGTMIVWDNMLFDASDNIAGSGAVSLSLYTAATKAVNTYGLTQDQIIVTGYLTYKGVIQTLQAKGYSAAILP